MSKQTSITGFFTNNNHAKKRKLSNIDSDSENERNKKRVKRRKIENEMKDEESTDEDNDNYYFDSNKKQPSCNVIRGKIRAMLAEGNVKVTHWLKEINVNSNSYQRFMKLKGFVHIYVFLFILFLFYISVFIMKEHGMEQGMVHIGER